MIAAEIARLLAGRASDASICPSDVARSLCPGDSAGWRLLMPQIRAVVGALMGTGQVRATRGERTLSAERLEGGPIRIRRGPRFEA